MRKKIFGFIKGVLFIVSLIVIVPLAILLILMAFNEFMGLLQYIGVPVDTNKLTVDQLSSWFSEASYY